MSYYVLTIFRDIPVSATTASITYQSCITLGYLLSPLLLQRLDCRQASHSAVKHTEHHHNQAPIYDRLSIMVSALHNMYADCMTAPAELRVPAADLRRHGGHGFELPAGGAGRAGGARPGGRRPLLRARRRPRVLCPHVHTLHPETQERRLCGRPVHPLPLRLHTTEGTRSEHCSLDPLHYKVDITHLMTTKGVPLPAGENRTDWHFLLCKLQLHTGRHFLFLLHTRNPQQVNLPAGTTLQNQSGRKIARKSLILHTSEI